MYVRRAVKTCTVRSSSTNIFNIVVGNGGDDALIIIIFGLLASHTQPKWILI